MLFEHQSQSDCLASLAKSNTLISIAIALSVASTGSLCFAGVKAKAIPAKTTGDKPSDKSDKSPTKAAPPEPPIENVTGVTTTELVDKPHEFLNKNVKFTAKFYVFSNLPLDYKPALRSSKTHLGFLVLRPESHVPFSELKIAMPIPKEKEPMNQLLGSLKDGDQIEVIAKVFSTQLDEPWLDVLRLKRLSSAPEEKDKTASADHDATTSPHADIKKNSADSDASSKSNGQSRESHEEKKQSD